MTSFSVYYNDKTDKICVCVSVYVCVLSLDKFILLERIVSHRIQYYFLKLIFVVKYPLWLGYTSQNIYRKEDLFEIAGLTITHLSY